MTDPTSPCRLCALTRAAWRAVQIALLPRTLAFFGAIAVLAAMAPSSIPPSTINAPPKGAAAPSSATSAAAAAAFAGAAASATATSAAASAAAAAASGAAAVREAANGSLAATDKAGARSAAAASGATGAASAAPKAALAPGVRFRDVATLPSARVGVPWRHKMLEGTPPYVMRFVGERPPWLDEFAAGTLAGTPREAKTETFTLQGSAEGGTLTVTQTFSVRVLPPIVPKPTPEPQALKDLRPQERMSAPAGYRDLPFTWRLDEADLEKLSAPPDSSSSSEQATSEAALDLQSPNVLALARSQAATAPPRPSAKQWKAMLGPLVGVDYPTEAHFRKMLRIAHCFYFGEMLKNAARERSKQGKPQVVPPNAYPCPWKRPPPKSAAAVQTAVLAADAWSQLDSGPLPLDEAFFELLPSEDRVVELAEKPHVPDVNFRPLWYAKPGCGCVPPKREEEVYGFVSYWGTAEQQAKRPPPSGAEKTQKPDERPKEARVTDFSLFSRLSFFGAMLNDLADYDMPDHVKEQAHALAREAQPHGTQVDLVLHRNEWDSLLTRSDADRAAMAKRAAENAIPLLNEPHQKLAFGQSLLLPFWRQENTPFGGLTVFFDSLPAANTPAGKKFREFNRTFVLSLIEQMQAEQKAGRRLGGYRLNIVVPDHQAAEAEADGLFTFEEMKEFIEKAEPRSKAKKFDADAQARNVGTTDIQLNYIILLSDRTTATKKQFRAKLDRSSKVFGVHRVVLLERMLPTLLRPTSVKASWSPDTPSKQFADDLAYIKWSFGGVTLWELPSTSQEDLRLMKALDGQFRLDNRRLAKVCDFVCPNRIGLRLLLQGLVAVGAVAIGLWFLNCAVRNWGRRYLLFLWGGGLLTVPLALALLECDPALQGIPPNLPLLLLIIALFAGGLYWSFKSRRARP